MKYKNPVIPGFYPDPSVCRVGDDYYLVTSSFEYFPGVPIFHSKDLINWRQIGNCLTRESQLNLDRARSTGGIFAPTIRYHNGTFYLITTNVTHKGNFFVHSKDPSGDWSDPVWVDRRGIDPSLFFDDDGRVYMANTARGFVVQSEIDLKTGSRLSETKRLWAGTGGAFPEAPHLYKVNGKYYLIIAEGGTEYGHMETIARGDSPWGPFESCPRNPILSHRSLAGPLQATGHGDLIRAHDGSWWIVFLGIRALDYQPYHCVGRETFLAPVKWADDGWPVVGDNGRASLDMEADCLPQHPCEKEPLRDDFDGGKLNLYWNFLRNPGEGSWSLTGRPGWLMLNGSELTLNDMDAVSFLGRRQRHLKCSVSTLLDFSPRRADEEAGLTVFMNERHHYEIAVTSLKMGRYVIVRRRIGNLAPIVARERIGSGPVKLGIKTDSQKYYFFYNMEKGKANSLAEGEARYVSSEVAGGCTGVYLAMYATGNGRRSSAPAFFDWFEYVPLEE